MKKIIVILGIILILLIIVSAIVSRVFFNKNIPSQSTITPVPTQSLSSPSPLAFSPPSDYQPAKLSSEEKQKMIADFARAKRIIRIPNLSEEQINQLTRLVPTLPYTTPDFAVDYYSSYTNEPEPVFEINSFIFIKYTPTADAKILEWAQKNNLVQLKDNPEVFTSIDISHDEEHVGIEDVQGANTTIEPLSGQVQGTSDSGNALLNFLKSLIDLDLSDGSEGGDGSGGGGPSASGNASLDAIFNEVAQKVGVPAKLLEEVMRTECGRISSLPPEQIKEYSTPGNPGTPPGSPGYCRSGPGAMGPMQFMPGTWPAYKYAVREFGGYTHEPSPWNILDSVYAAAKKLKSDGQASGPTMSCDQLRRAIICYNAGCGRVNNPPSETVNYLNKVMPAMGC